MAKSKKVYTITPTQKRQKKYMSAVWDFAVDGGAAETTPKLTSVLPKGAVIVDHVIETLSVMSASGTPTLVIKVGPTEITDTPLGWNYYNSPLEVAMPATDTGKMANAGAISWKFSGTVTGGKMAVTVGYFEAGDYLGLYN